jgi:hypothetical protein
LACQREGQYICTCTQRHAVGVHVASSLVSASSGYEPSCERSRRQTTTAVSLRAFHRPTRTDVDKPCPQTGRMVSARFDKSNQLHTHTHTRGCPDSPICGSVTARQISESSCFVLELIYNNVFFSVLIFIDVEIRKEKHKA